MPNAELAYRVLDQIHAHPELWDQGDWFTRPAGDDCGTAGCFAGWACLLSGDSPIWVDDDCRYTAFVWTPSGVDSGAGRRAAQLLNIDPYGDDADLLFSASNTLDDLERCVEQFFGPRPDVSAA